MKNKDRLEKEWEALCAYQAEPNASTVGTKDGNAKKNRSAAVVACKSLPLFPTPSHHLWPEPTSLYSWCEIKRDSSSWSLIRPLKATPTARIINDLAYINELWLRPSGGGSLAVIGQPVAVSHHAV